MLILIFMLNMVLLFGDVSGGGTNYHVVKGADVEVEKYPFVASLRIASRMHLCGSTIIARNWIMTAAHCIKSTSVEHISVQYGTSKVRPLGKNVVGVKRVIVHENYDSDKSQDNDIALLELTRSLKLDNKTLAAVTLPESKFEIPQNNKGASGVLLGWSRSATNGTVERDLEKIDIKMYSDAECKKKHKTSVTKDHICGEVTKNSKGGCYGDSGGPLIFKDSIQLGIASWIGRNFSCEESSYPGIYTKVSHYVDWIKEYISENEDDDYSENVCF